MKTSDRRQGFWADGQKSFLDQLRKEEAEILSPLENELKDATSPILKAEIRERIKAVKREYRRKRRASDSSLFITPGS